MGWAEAVLAIVIVVTIGRVMRSKYRAQHGILEDKEGNEILKDPGSDKLRDEVKYLKERVQVLEKIATEDRSARDLESEIEKLRDR